MNNRTKHDHLLLIKVGGSFITDKTRPFALLPNSIEHFASELRNVHGRHPNIDLLIGNGAGSFAHFSAHQYGLSHGAKTSAQYYGVSLAHNGVRRLNGIVADALTNVELAAFGLSPSSFFTSNDGKIVSDYFDPLKYLLAKGLIPVVHGDTILDVKRGTKIFSTEEILQECAKQLRKLYSKITVIYLLSTNGILDENGETIPHLGLEDELFVHERLEHDVTGGIVGKVTSARRVAKIADEVFLINGASSGELEKVITAGHAGTKVE